MASTTSTTEWRREQRRNTQRLAAWTAAWVATVALSTFGPALLWGDARVPTIAAIAVQFAVGIGMILANRRHLLGLDELQQRIHLNAMGVTLGVGLVVGIAYSTLDATNIIAADAEISALVLVMGMTYLVAALIGTRRYT